MREGILEGVGGAVGVGEEEGGTKPANGGVAGLLGT